MNYPYFDQEAFDKYWGNYDDDPDFECYDEDIEQGAAAPFLTKEGTMDDYFWEKIAIVFANIMFAVLAWMALIMGIRLMLLAWGWLF